MRSVGYFFDTLPGGSSSNIGSPVIDFGTKSVGHFADLSTRWSQVETTGDSNSKLFTKLSVY